uniref:Cyclic nucleotide-binding domain-containing protein n=1 Tax=Gongylonema pulchrum TaxID=637853 RepID=A0A183ELT1_9BILA
LHENDGGVTVQAMGRQRCRILTRRSAVNGMPYGEVRVLEEIELPPISRALQPISFSRLSSSKNLRYCAAITSHSYFALKMSLTQHYQDCLVNWLVGWHPSGKIKYVLSQGATAFSYWVAANLPIDMETRLRLLTEPCTDRRLVNECGILKQASFHFVALSISVH